MEGPVKRLLPVMLLCAALLPCTCHNNPPVPQGQPDLVVDGRLILVEPSLSRFYPHGSRDGEPLLVYIRLAASDSAPLPVGLAATRAWVVCDADAWETGLTEHAAKRSDYHSAYYAEGGPKWTPGLNAGVTVRIIQSGGGTWDILVRDCVVGAIQQY
jgi:hypothetical protein